jgi:hypothetical protein
MSSLRVSLCGLSLMAFTGCAGSGVDEGSSAFAATAASADQPTACSQPFVAKRPSVCPQLLLPVCGCDGVTYGNACEAMHEGVAVAFQGACSPPVVGAGEVCGGALDPVACDEGLSCRRPAGASRVAKGVCARDDQSIEGEPCGGFVVHRRTCVPGLVCRHELSVNTDLPGICDRE